MSRIFKPVGLTASPSSSKSAWSTWKNWRSESANEPDASGHGTRVDSRLKTQGFVEDRQTGSHLTLVRLADGAVVTIPVHTGCDVGRGLTVRVLKDAGYAVEDYLRLR